jgi:hypothetical protein
MLKEQVFNILGKNFSKISSDNEIVNYKTILESDIHPSIKNYIKSELKILFSRDKALIKKKSVFNYSSVKTDFLFHQIFDELIKSTFISSEEVNNLLLQAISFNLSHLIKPNWSLRKIIFNDKKNISSNDFFYLIEYAFFYPYQKNIVVKYFKKFDYNLIDSEKFEETLKKIDIKLFKENKKEILLDFFNVALDFIDTAKTNFLHSEIILSYLSDKGLAEEYDIIKKYIDKNKIDKLSKTEFEQILFNTNSDLQNKNIQDDKQDLIITHEEEDLLDSNELNETSDNENLHSKIKFENNSSDSENLSLFDEELEDESSNEESETTKQLKSELQSLKNEADNINYNLASDFLKYFSEKEIQRIQENIFNSDSEDFVFMIEKIISASSYEDSIQILNEIVQLYQIDYNSKEINLLKSALQKFYKG